jgi:uncharacterized pyridoxamine 5'-phosphate oxidase family protein
MKEVLEFFKKSKTFYLSTIEGDQPRVRPFGAVEVFEEYLYILTGKQKKVSQQMSANPKVEICAFHGGKVLRVQAIVVEDDRTVAKQYMLDNNPYLANQYAADDENMQVLYLRDAVATFIGPGEEPQIICF